jgi:hypothetical protein
VARVLSTAIVLALLAATAAAFALTERAKVERAPIYGTKIVNPIFSPDGRGKKTVTVEFRVRSRERVDVWMQDAKGHKADDLLVNTSVKPRQKLILVWDGIGQDGIAAADGVYMPVVKLLRSHRTITLPSKITLDTKPPVITVKHPQYPIISPDGDGHRDAFRFTYRVDEPAHGILLVRGRQEGYTKSQKLTGEMSWNGQVKNRSGGLSTVGPGRYLLGVAAQDQAGNVSKGFPFAIAQVRYLTLARDRVVVRPGGKFALRVSTDAPTVEWRLHGAHGTQPRGTLHFRAPRSAGVYRLYVTVGSHSAKCSVVVA